MHSVLTEHVLNYSFDKTVTFRKEEMEHLSYSEVSSTKMKKYVYVLKLSREK